MRVYGLTKLGRQIVQSKDGTSEEMRVLQYIQGNKTATDSELEVVGGDLYTLRVLKTRGLITELTTE